MMKKLLVLLAGLFALSAAWAAVDANTANETQLQEVRGIGPSTARAIVKERTDSGPYKNADDLAARVKGIGPKSLLRLQEQGLSIGGAAAAETAAAAPAPAAQPARGGAPKK